MDEILKEVAQRLFKEATKDHLEDYPYHGEREDKIAFWKAFYQENCKNL